MRHSLAGSYLRSVKVEERARWSGAALVLVSGAVDGRAVRVLGGGTGPEQAQLADLHPRPELDRQRGDVRQLQGDVAREARVDPPRGGVGEQAKAAETRFPL